ncbi:response regulator [Silvanigrella paludirubra]|uniref:histidine kinase n=1 Tax=Silvanigrella paludirubra TaxID=2499159 RepID=A0A6N6VZI0_9BACT|nr:response regulator [Silvanigrella paludirubra]KAB8039908.1 response regulator [Silvanigrella paludirubra]
MNTTSIKILIVEDEIILAKNLEDTLIEMGYQVVGISDNAMKAIMMFFLHEPDLILMDIHLKGEVDGIQTAEKILEQKAVPIVFLTANQDPATFQRAKIEGAFGYILKPFQEREMQIVIDIAISQFEERKKIARLESMLLNSEKFNSIDTFASGIIHNINTYLTSIFIASDILKKEDALNSNYSIETALELLEKGANSIKNTIKNYNNIIENKEFEKPNLFNLKNICKEAIEICKYYSLEKKVIIKELLGNQDTCVWIGYSNFFQVIVNLIKNACDAVEKTKDAWLQISWEDLNERIVQIKVTDSGNGIPKDICDKIFEPLFTTKSIGLGLGLSSCRHILQKYGANIHIDETNKNTCFLLEIKKTNF